jgi:hypothetical protein
MREGEVGSWVGEAVGDASYPLNLRFRFRLTFYVDQIMFLCDDAT